MTSILDRPIWHALSTRHAAFARGSGQAKRYSSDHSVLAGTRDDLPHSLAALRGLLRPGEQVALFTPAVLELPDSLAPVYFDEMVQMVLRGPEVAGGVAPLPAAARLLSAADVPSMLALVALAQPGPFCVRTNELGRFMGVFADGLLVAMAGERLCLDKFVEISGVCTHPDYRGRGWSASLIAALARAAFQRGQTPMLHAVADNAGAIALYRKLGFTERRTMRLTVLGRAEDQQSGATE